jgi:hypothetical protein
MTAKTYIVYAYQYNDMARPRIGAQAYKEWGRDLSTWDCLPPTVTVCSGFTCASRKDAIAMFRQKWPAYRSTPLG